jgi:hypothetical protein
MRPFTGPHFCWGIKVNHRNAARPSQIGAFSCSNFCYDFSLLKLE